MAFLQIDVWELLSDNYYLSASLHRQGLLVAAPLDLRTKKAGHFSPQLLQGFWSKLKEKKPKIVVMSSMVTTISSKQKEVMWQQHHLCLAVAQHQILGGTNPYTGTRNRKDFVVEKRTLPSAKVPPPMDSPAWQET